MRRPRAARSCSQPSKCKAARRENANLPHSRGGSEHHVFIHESAPPASARFRSTSSKTFSLRNYRSCYIVPAFISRKKRGAHARVETRPPPRRMDAHRAGQARAATSCALCERHALARRPGLSLLPGQRERDAARGRRPERRRRGERARLARALRGEQVPRR